MTAPTPEQMRALADSLNGIELALPEYTGSRVLSAAAALRAAADQLEAVQRLREAYAAFTASGGSSDD